MILKPTRVEMMLKMRKISYLRKFIEFPLRNSENFQKKGEPHQQIYKY